MPTAIYIHAVQHESIDDVRRCRLTPAEVHQRATERRAGSLAWELGRPEDEDATAAIATAIDADADLATALEPRKLDEHHIGIVVNDEILEKVRTAIEA